MTSNVHGPNENIRIEDFLQGIKFIAEFIHRFAFDRPVPAGGSEEEA